MTAVQQQSETLPVVESQVLLANLLVFPSLLETRSLHELNSR